MPNWKKVIVSGSDAYLRNLTASGHFAALDGGVTVEFDSATQLVVEGTITASSAISSSGHLFASLSLSSNNLKTVVYDSSSGQLFFTGSYGGGGGGSGGGVASIEGLTGIVDLAAGPNITLNTTGQTIEITGSTDNDWHITADNSSVTSSRDVLVTGSTYVTNSIYAGTSDVDPNKGIYYSNGTPMMQLTSSLGGTDKYQTFGLDLTKGTLVQGGPLNLRSSNTQKRVFSSGALQIVPHNNARPRLEYKTLDPPAITAGTAEPQLEFVTLQLSTNSSYEKGVVKRQGRMQMFDEYDSGNYAAAITSSIPLVGSTLNIYPSASKVSTMVMAGIKVPYDGADVLEFQPTLKFIKGGLAAGTQQSTLTLPSVKVVLGYDEWIPNFNIYTTKTVGWETSYNVDYNITSGWGWEDGFNDSLSGFGSDKVGGYRMFSNGVSQNVLDGNGNLQVSGSWLTNAAASSVGAGLVPYSPICIGKNSATDDFLFFWSPHTDFFIGGDPFGAAYVNPSNYNPIPWFPGILPTPGTIVEWELLVDYTLTRY